MNAQSVAVACALITSVSCVICVFAAWWSSKWAGKLRSTASTLAELSEIRDYMGKLDNWAKRINARDKMQERRSDMSDGATAEPRKSSRPVSTNDKDELRRRAGLVAGQPARHN